ASTCRTRAWTAPPTPLSSSGIPFTICFAGYPPSGLIANSPMPWLCSAFNRHLVSPHLTTIPYCLVLSRSVWKAHPGERSVAGSCAHSVDASNSEILLGRSGALGRASTAWCRHCSFRSRRQRLLRFPPRTVAAVRGHADMARTTWDFLDCDRLVGDRVLCCSRHFWL